MERVGQVGGMDGARMKERRKGYHANPHIRRGECQRKQEPGMGPSCSALCLCYVCKILETTQLAQYV